MCIACRKKDRKGTLIRIAKKPDGYLALDTTQQLGGRGSYICKNRACIEKVIQEESLSRAFKMQVKNDKIYEELETVIGNKEKQQMFD